MSESEVHESSPVSFMQRYRLHLIGGGAFLLVIIALLAGIAAGMAKRNFEKQFYLDQIEKLKIALEKSGEKYHELDAELAETKVQLRAKKDHVEELEYKVESLEKRLKGVGTAPEAARGVESSGVAAPAPAVQGAALPRLSGDCTVKSGGATGSSALQDCLRPGASGKAAPAEPAHGAEKGVEAAKPAEKPAKSH
ncbi:hypothetical protein [Chitinilyticum piscinae]|uniref:Uncharacterized protein n=1 Tax=Chitinilyticum piscinae TaxID=2866724 RepID=A0A8J7K1Y6_9NEIS|nr:hypothetical protein [Chitinilyticum piscinae]MBE9609866.1 hypothetical protein [Chitinilyticum piscinae]